jgi:hypothetical protein
MHKRYLWALAGALAFTVSVLGPANAAAPPAGWKAENINGADGGSTDVTGTGAEAVWTVTGTGEDIWGAADSFHFAYTTLNGDGRITARILEQKGGHSDGWAKSGTMLRETNEGGSRTAYLVYCNGEDYPDRPGRAFEPAFRRETDVGDPVRGDGGDFGPATDSNMGRRIDKGLGPIWMATQRKGQTYSHWLSEDGKAWKLVSKLNLDIPASAPLLAGLCVCQHGVGDSPNPAVAKFDNVSVSNDVIVPPPPGPNPVIIYPGTDAVLLTYGLQANAVAYNIYRRGAAEPETAAVKVNPEPTPYGFYIDRGLTTGAPLKYHVRAVFADGSEGTPSRTALATPQAPLPGGFVSWDLGTQTAGFTKLEGNVLEIGGSGADIWEDRDQFRFVAVPVSGDFQFTAQMLEVPKQNGSTDGWNKSGIMIRESLDTASRYATMQLTAGYPFRFTFKRVHAAENDRVEQNLAEIEMLPLDQVTYPMWMRLTRSGSTISGHYSTDGSNYQTVDDAKVTLRSLPLAVYAGLYTTNHTEGFVSSAKFAANRACRPNAPRS